MAKNLRTFLNQLKTEDYLRVEAKTAVNLGIPSYLFELEEKKNYPAVLFTNATNSKGDLCAFPVLANLFASRERLAQAVDTDTNHLAEEIYRRSKPGELKMVTKQQAPVKEVVLRGDEVDINILPAVTHHQGDAGGYITGASVWCKDVDTGEYNCAMVRIWAREKMKLGTHLNPHGHSYFHYCRWAEQKKPMPVIICIGHHPAFYLGTQVKSRGDEVKYISGLLDEPLTVTPSESFNGEMLVPADAEIVLEGEIPPGVLETEGPFGDYTGYIDMPKPHNVIELKAMTFRRDAIYLDVFPGHRDHFLLDAPMLEHSLLKQLQLVVPTVKKVFLPYSGCCRLHAYISLKKTNDGQPRTIIARALTTDFRLKHVVVVDDDIDVEKEEEVWWAVATRSQWGKDLMVLTEVNGTVLDPSGDNGLTSKGGIDATVPLSKPFPPRSIVSERK